MKRLVKVCLVALCLCLGITALTGCGGDFIADTNIAVITREVGSGTRDGIVEALYGANNNDNHALISTNSDAAEIKSTQAVLQSVANNKYAISYDSFGYCLGNSKIKVLEYEGKVPTKETIKDGSYAITRPFVIISKAGNPLASLTGNA